MTFLRRIKHLFTHFPEPERVILAQSIFLLLLVAVVRRILRLRQMQYLLAKMIPLDRDIALDDAERMTKAKRVAHLVQFAALHGLTRANCLERSLVLWAILRSQRFSSNLRLGVCKQNGRFDAHAWVEFNGVVLNDSADVEARYTVLSTF
jgi:hypothetical protein